MCFFCVSVFLLFVCFFCLCVFFVFVGVCFVVLFLPFLEGDGWAGDHHWLYIITSKESIVQLKCYQHHERENIKSRRNLDVYDIYLNILHTVRVWCYHLLPFYTHSVPHLLMKFLKIHWMSATAIESNNNHHCIIASSSLSGVIAYVISTSSSSSSSSSS